MNNSSYGLLVTGFNLSARREVLSRLLKLNHERYEEEVRAGLHEKRTKKECGKKMSNKGKKTKTKNRKPESPDGQLGKF